MVLCVTLTFYNALQMFDSVELFRQLGIFCIIVVFAISMSVYGLYLNQMLQIRWRRWLTHKYLGDWLADRAYYKLHLGSTTDNPDQRIAEDLNQFTAFIMNLSVGLISSVASLASFLVILWGLSGPAQIPLGRWGTLQIPAYLVWAALLYASIGTWLTIKIGQPLVPLNFDRQRFEADFRFSLVRLRENAESVALYGGEAVERGIFRGRFPKRVRELLADHEEAKASRLFYIGLYPRSGYFPRGDHRTTLFREARSPWEA